MYCLCLVLIFVLLCINNLGIFHANHLCVLIHIRIKGEIDTVKHVQYIFLLDDPRYGASFVDLFIMYGSCLSLL